MDQESNNDIGWGKQVDAFVSGHSETQKKPRAMAPESMDFIIAMVMSELTELLRTHPSVHNIRDAKLHMIQILLNNIDENRDFSKPEDPAVIIDSEVDALVDVCYYCIDTMIRNGTQPDPFFALVNDANLAKRFPDGTFHKRPDGKIIKPEGWKPADTLSLIKKMMD